jgi:hypothetical protein
MNFSNISTRVRSAFVRTAGRVLDRLEVIALRSYPLWVVTLSVLTLFVIVVVDLAQAGMNYFSEVSDTVARFRRDISKRSYLAHGGKP